MHPLLRYAKEHQISQVVLAERVGLSPQFLNDVIWGRSRLSGHSTMQVVESLGGALTFAELVAAGPKPKRRKKNGKRRTRKRAA